MSRRAAFAAAALLLTLAACSKSTGGAFSDPNTKASPQPPAVLDLNTMTSVRNQLLEALGRHTSVGHLDLSWGTGPAYTTAGPYHNNAATVDALDLLVASAPGGPGGSAPSSALPGAIVELSASTTAEYHDLTGPNGAAYLVLARIAAVRAPASCPSGPAGDPTCLRAGFSDALKTGWYAGDSKSYFHVGDPTTVYRPVDAFSLGAALVVAGYDEHNDDKISAGSEIIGKEMNSDFDQHFGMTYGLMSATAKGGRQATDFNTHISDQAGIAEFLLQAFDASREQQYLTGARQVLQPLLDDRAGARAQYGYIAGFDMRGTGADPNSPVDTSAAYLTLQAARHYDRDDGGRYARLEEAAAQAMLAGAAQVDASQGLPGGIVGQAPSPRSGMVTALAVVALNDILTHPPGAPPPPPGTPPPTPGG